MERQLTVEFGPSRSKRFGKALAEAENGPGECSELEPGRYRASFVLGSHAAAYTALARLLERVRHWRASEVHDEPVSAYHAKEMAWCASSQLKSFGECRFRFSYGSFPFVLSAPSSMPSEQFGTCWEKTRFRRSSSRSPTDPSFAPAAGGPGQPDSGIRAACHAFSVRVPVQTLDMISAFPEEPLPTVVTLAGPRASLSAKRRRTPEAEAC